MSTLTRLLAEHDGLAGGRARARVELPVPRTAGIFGAMPRFSSSAAKTIPAAIGEDDGAGLRPPPSGRSATTTASRSLASSSIARALVAVRSFHGFCARKRDCSPTDPSEEVDAPRVPQGIPKALDEVAGRRCSWARSRATTRCTQRDRALLETLYATGIRISEAVGLELGDLDLEDGVVRVLGKGDKERIVPIGRSARRVVGHTCPTAG